jgi:Uma2 family endonuclease
MAPTGSDAGISSGGVFAQLWSWDNQHRAGYTFDSSTGFRLPNGAIRSPDAAWIPKERYEALAPPLRRGFAPICPDFVAEVVSPSDDLEAVQAKLREYILNGARLGWLIDPETRRVEIYQPGASVIVLDNPATQAVLTWSLSDRYVDPRAHAVIVPAAALRRAGLNVAILPPHPEHHDCVFIEDTLNV